MPYTLAHKIVEFFSPTTKSKDFLKPLLSKYEKGEDPSEIFWVHYVFQQSNDSAK